MLDTTMLARAYRLMCQVSSMASLYDTNRQICKYVHSTSRGHEAVQLGAAFNLLPCDFVSPYYRDDGLLLGMGFTPYELMLQLLAKANDIFSGGREYYAHPSYNGSDKPRIIHQSSATGMQAIPTTGLAQGISFLEQHLTTKLIKSPAGDPPVVLCSLGDASVTEGEVSEAFQVAALKKLPIIYLVQDNDWGISVTAREARSMDAFEFAAGFPGLMRRRVEGYRFEESYLAMKEVIADVRQNRRPWVVHAKVPLLGHHTSGVRKEFYRDPKDLAEHAAVDPRPLLREKLLASGLNAAELDRMEREEEENTKQQFAAAVASEEPDPSEVTHYVFAPANITTESGERTPAGKPRVLMVDAALFAIREIMEDHPEAILFGQDVGRRLGGVFREAATLAEQFGDHRVFNTAIQEAYIIGSTAGLCAAGLKPIVEIQFADYVYPGLNQLATEIAKSCYLTCGKFPVQTLIRIPTGAYGGGGPYHSASIETALLSIKGIKVVYPSNAADMKGLMKAAFLDPNPVVMLEHKGLYWSKIPGTEQAKTIEPERNYVLPLGKATIVQHAAEQSSRAGASCCVVTYGMGVYWAKTAASEFPGQVEIVDLRTLFPLDEELVFSRVRVHGRCLVLTEEQQNNSFAEALAGRISRACFKWLDGPVEALGSIDVPGIPMNTVLENAVLPGSRKVAETIRSILNY